MTDRRSIGIVAVLGVLAFAPAVQAAPSLAVWAEGHDAGRMGGVVAKAVPSEWTVTPAHAVARASRGLHAKKLQARLGELAGRLKVQAVIYVRAEPREHKVLLVLAQKGAEAVERRVAMDAVGATVVELLGPRENVNANTNTNVNVNANVNENANAAPVPTPTPTVSVKAKPKAKAAPVPVAPSARPTTGAAAVVVARPAPSPPGTLVAIWLTGGVGGRRLLYNQPITNNLPSYSAAAVPWLGVRAVLFPLAHTGVRFLRDVGLFGDFGQSVYQQSAVAGGPRLNATWSMFDAGLRWRLRFRETHGVSPGLGAAVAYGRTAYTFDDGGQLVGGTPSVDYRFVRPAVDGRVAFGPVVLYVDAGYRAVLSAGYVGSHFPRASIGGIDVGAGFAFTLPRRFELGLSGQYVRYFYDMRSQPGDPYVAGGAVDEFALGELSLGYVF